MRGVDKEALVHECLVEHYEKYYRIAYSYTFQEQDALDIVQEGAYRAILKSDSLKNPEYADTWMKCRRKGCRMSRKIWIFSRHF